MKMRRMVVAAAIGLVIAVSACGNGAPTTGGGGGGTVGKAAASGLGPATTTVQATANLTFAPDTSTVKVGTVLQWTNTGSVPHNVTFDAYADLTSPTLQQNDTWQVQFTTPGTYPYHCTFHPNMNGTITVSG